MSSPEHLIQVESQVAEEDLRDSLESLGTSSPVEEQRTYYDTFDWRLNEAGLVLCSTRSLNEPDKLVRLEAADGRVTRRARMTGVPTFAKLFPTGPLRNAIEPLIEARRLLPIVSFHSRGMSFRVLGDEQKTVAKVSTESARAKGPGNWCEIGHLIRVEPLKGFEKHSVQIAEQLARRHDGEALDSDELGLALAHVGRHRADTRLDLTPRLRRDLDAVEGARIPLRFQLRTILMNLDGAKGDLDAEFLHDLRVAVRRTRSLLPFLEKALGERLQHFRDEWKWVQTLTGPTRDLDVAMETLTTYPHWLGEATDLLPLERQLSDEKLTAHRQMLREIETSRFGELTASWLRFLEPSDDKPRSSARRIGPMVDRRLAKMYRRICRLGDAAVENQSPAAELHRVRILGKKLRYGLEAYRTLYPEELRDAIRTLKKLQDHLGEFNDLEFQRDTLRRIGASGALPSDTQIVVGRLIERFSIEQERRRLDFAKRFGRFSTAENRERFRTLLSAGAKS